MAAGDGGMQRTSGARLVAALEGLAVREHVMAACREGEAAAAGLLDGHR